MKIKSWELLQRQSLSLEMKIAFAKKRIIDWYNYWDGNVYIAFSGGKDSTVMLNIVRKLYPDVPAVFANTGLEYPEIRNFVKTIDNVIWIRPKYTFREIIEKYGYPVVSKMQSQYIEQYRNTKSEKLKKIRWEGVVINNVRNYKISEKWKYLINAPFKISDKCCKYMKKIPFAKYEKKNKKYPYIGIMASDSIQRKKQYLQQGCNVFEGKRLQSRPLAIWNDKDVWEYIKKYNIKYSEIYNKGLKRTGCMFCMFGVHLEKEPNRFQIMEKIHPKLWKYSMEKLGLKDVLQYMRIPYHCHSQNLLFENKK